MKLAGKWTKANFNGPDIISHYNTNMGGVDLADKKIMTYKWHMKGIKWPLKVFWYIIDVCITNAHILHPKISGNPETLRHFRENLSTQLVGDRSFCKRSLTVTGDATEQRGTRFNRDLNHAPHLNEKQKRCMVHQQRCNTKYSCVVCKIYMCPFPCFGCFHYLSEYAYNDPSKAISAYMF